MTVNAQDFAKAGVQSAAFFANTALDSIERLATLNLNAARSLVETSFANAAALLGAKDVQAFVSLQQSLAAPAIEQGLAYSRNVYAITTETKDKLAKAVESQVAEANATVSGLVDKALASAPAGSEPVVAAVKSAIAATNNALEGISKVSKQVAEAAEASVSAATEATLKATKAATAAPKAKKAA